MDHRLEVYSPDGTRIAANRHGSGAPLILVHGVCDDHQGFRRVAPHLVDRFTVYAVDRRGRGMSGDAENYDFQREVEDMVALAGAVAEHTQQPAGVFAHSFGALVAGEAAMVTEAIGRLMLFELAPPTSDALVDDLFAKTRAGDADGIIRALICGLQKNPPEVFQRLRADHSRWPRYDGLAASVARELYGALHYQYDAARLGSRRLPTRFLLGGTSAAVMVRYTETAMAAMAGSDRVVIGGLDHGAMRTGAGEVAAEIRNFCRPGSKNRPISQPPLP
jgi:pimeloyl-ACP methyl ester carboxylesterase